MLPRFFSLGRIVFLFKEVSDMELENKIKILAASVLPDVLIMSRGVQSVKYLRSLPSRA